jgi:hypothetical protein
MCVCVWGGGEGLIRGGAILVHTDTHPPFVPLTSTAHCPDDEEFVKAERGSVFKTPADKQFPLTDPTTLPPPTTPGYDRAPRQHVRGRHRQCGENTACIARGMDFVRLPASFPSSHTHTHNTHTHTHTHNQTTTYPDACHSAMPYV